MNNIIKLAIRYLALGFGILLYASGTFGQTVYHVDAINGNDIAGNGSINAPFASYQAVRDLLVEGDTVLFYDGNYGSVLEGVDSNDSPINTLFTDWVTFKAAEGENPVFGTLQFGLSNTNFKEGGASTSAGEGVISVYMRFEGITFAGGVKIYGGLHVEIISCTINVPAPYYGSLEAISKSAVGMRFASDILIKDNDITETAGGIYVGRNSYRVNLIGNHIHHITHDGIQLIGAHDTLVEGNHIHNLDDGVRDGEEISYNRHCDGIHMYPEQSSHVAFRNENITIRGNRIYHCENSNIQFNSKEPMYDHNIVIENNIFGPGSDGNAVNMNAGAENLVFRNNSMIYFPDGDSYTSLFDTRECANHVVQLPGKDLETTVEIYNNILYRNPVVLFTPTRLDHNMYLFPQSGYVAAAGDIDAGVQQFANPENYDGVLVENSLAADSGILVDAEIADFYEHDIYGTLRDSAPDMGAVEISTPSHPVADAGNTINVVLPNESVLIDGSDSYDSGGQIVAYLWKQVHGASVTLNGIQTDTLQVSNLVEGRYAFQLMVTDSEGLTDTDTVTVVVSQTALEGSLQLEAEEYDFGRNVEISEGVVGHIDTGDYITFDNIDFDPGFTNIEFRIGAVYNDKTVEVRLDAVNGPLIATHTIISTGGYPDGWSTFEIQTASITGSPTGKHTLFLVFYGGNGIADLDWIKLTKDTATGISPVADAGGNQTVTLPTDSVVLDGSNSYDPDGTIESYLWQQTSGPEVTLSNEQAAVLTVSDLVQGTYTFSLTVTDNNSMTNADTITVTVNPPASIYLEAEEYDDASGVTILDDKIGSCDSGDYVVFRNLNFSTDLDYIEFNLSAVSSSKSIEVRVDGVDGILLTTHAVTATGPYPTGWTTYQIQGSPIANSVTGTHDLYLVFVGGYGVANIDWLRLGTQ